MLPRRGSAGPSLQRVAKVYASTAEAIAHFKPTPREVISGDRPARVRRAEAAAGAAPRRGEAVLVRARRAEALVAAARRYSDLMGRTLDLSRYALPPADVFADLNVKFDPRNAQNNPKWRRKAPPTIRMQRPPVSETGGHREGAAHRPLPPRSMQRSRNVPPSTANRGVAVISGSTYTCSSEFLDHFISLIRIEGRARSLHVLRGGGPTSSIFIIFFFANQRGLDTHNGI